MRIIGVVVVVVLLAFVSESVAKKPARLKIMHKFSSEAKEAMRSRNGADYGSDWPSEDTIAFQTMLRNLDVGRHTYTERRMLAQQQQYVFAGGNATEQLFGGGLHYAYIEIGTPNVQFLVVLDTGSDLLWIPCECVSCAPLSAPSKDPRTSILNAYTPSQSSTAKPVLCSDPLCAKSATCASTDQCPYEIKYVSANTSTSGTIYEDVLYFMPEAGGNPVTLPIYLGCGQMQTGSLLKGAAPDGLMGLGMTDISVPNKLASTGQMVDSFSMCISSDGSGMITFGDAGPAGQQTTPIIPFATSGLETYIVEIDSLIVGTTTVSMASQALFDTGTSFTYLSKSAYQSFVQAYHAQMTLPTYSFNNWDLCYQTSNSNFQVPKMTLTFSGGTATMDIVSGLKSIVDSTGAMVAVCVTVMDSGADLSIIGQNFMTNFSITYNRGDMLLGWTSSDCNTDLTPSVTNTTTPAPTVSPPSNSTTIVSPQPPSPPPPPPRRVPSTPPQTITAVPPTSSNPSAAPNSAHPSRVLSLGLSATVVALLGWVALTQ